MSISSLMASKDRWWRLWQETAGATILHVDLTPCAEREARAFDLLDAREARRAQRFVVEPPRRRFALCRAALRANLCERLDCRNELLSFNTLEHGKPVAAVNGQRVPIAFNLSHSGGHGLIAIAAHQPLGIDLEERRPVRNFDGIGKRVYGPAERRLLAQAEGTRKAALFYRLWTLKEALIKALGTGFRLNPATFEVPGPMLRGERSGRFQFPHQPEDYWQLVDLGEPRFAAALAIRVRDLTVADGVSLRETPRLGHIPKCF
ncbi:MAG: 4'-phosphopantetheinyl transferase superfamily protein [Gammaproteobacteria bacterium]|nr:4'-phosphopantetheinyl transferase superfamily protein [Gammaproteobacteria bacterium]